MAATAVPMGIQDELWLTMDRPNNLMVVDGALLLAADVPVEAVREVYAGLVERFPVFARRAVPTRGGRWSWADDPDFDLARHIAEVQLPEPCDIAALQALMSERRSRPLDPQRPRWQVLLVHGVRLADGTTGAAVVSRFHHAIADGVRLVQVMLGLCETDPETEVLPPDTGKAGLAEHSALHRARDAVVGAAGGAAQSVAGAAGSLLGAVRHPGRVLPRPAEVRQFGGRAVHDGAELAQLAGHGFGLEMLRRPDRVLDVLEHLGLPGNRGIHDASSLTKLSFAATPRTVWTGTPGISKAVAWSEPIPLADIKAIGHALGATVNDVMLAAVAGALRQYLLEHGGLHVDEVNWMVPVNLRPLQLDSGDLGNAFALVFLPMPLHHPEAAARLEAMHRTMERIKDSDEAVMTFGLQQVVARSPSQVAFALTNFFANKAVGVLTNVPGPRATLRFAGTEVRQVIGFAPSSGDQTMTTSIFSYRDGVTVGFATDATLVPDPSVLVDHVLEELAALRSAVDTAG
jgi:diacylglycerol O-acyltransferase